METLSHTSMVGVGNGKAFSMIDIGKTKMSKAYINGTSRNDLGIHPL